MQPSSWKRLLGILVPVALFASLVAWGFSSPVGSSPDDDYHMASIWCGQGVRENLCEPGDTPGEMRVPQALFDYGDCYVGKPDKSATCPIDPVSNLTSTTRGNFNDHGYPGLYYAVMSVFASGNIGLSILVMRTLNALLFTGLVTALFFVLRPGRRGPLLWGTMAASIPLGVFIVPSVNPSSWAFTSAAVLWMSAYTFLTAVKRRDRVTSGILAVAATLIGAGARGDSAAYNVLALGIAAILSFERTRRYLYSLALPAVLTVISAAFFLSAGQSGILVPSSSESAQTPTEFIGLLGVNLLGLPQLWTGSLGTWSLGWFDTTLPAVVPTFTCAVFAGLAFWGLRRLYWRKSVAVAVLAFSLVVVPLYILTRGQIVVGGYVQPRYILPLLVIFAGVILVGARRDDLALNLTQLVVAGTMLAAAFGVSLFTNLRRYVVGASAHVINLDSHISWWWPSPVPGPMAVWILGSLAFGVFVAGVIVYSRVSARERASIATIASIG
ncbi:DUF2142 domain-containing protein [Leifsonia sp. NPDC058230]|uniref:DUF2142 domain-containing protein n=1 Tax=Leifsonia sp. NPDC058230 TaxID=3346391 RepID=UPI0036DCAF8D